MVDESFRETVRVFDRHALEYDMWYLRNRVIFESEVEALKRLKFKGVGLEIGVGSGVFAQHLKVNIGIDPSISMLKIAKSRGVEVVLAIGECLPFKNEVFDYIVIIVTICFLSNPTLTLREARRVLKVNGSLGICFVPKESKWGTFYRKKAVQGHKFYKHARFYSIDEVLNMLRKNRFKPLLTIGTLFQEPGNVEYVERPKKSVRGAGFVCIKSVKEKGYEDKPVRPH